MISARPTFMNAIIVCAVCFYSREQVRRFVTARSARRRLISRRGKDPDRVPERNLLVECYVELLMIARSLAFCLIQGIMADMKFSIFLSCISRLSVVRCCDYVRYLFINCHSLVARKET